MNNALLLTLSLTVVTGCATASQGAGGAGGGDSTSPSTNATQSNGTGNLATNTSTGTASATACTWSACGGNPIGEWTYSNDCVEITKSDDSCPGAWLGFRNYLTGKVVLHADGTASVDSTLVQETDVYYPKTCWAPNATKCEDFVQGPGLTCMNTATDCLCKTTTQMPNGPSTDTFTMHDDHIVFSDGTDFTFCADSQHLLLIHDTGERTYLDAIE